MSRVGEALTLLNNELSAHIEDFDWGKVVPASSRQLEEVASYCAPLELPVELLDLWAWNGGVDIEIPMLYSGEFAGATTLHPPDAAFEIVRQMDESWIRTDRSPHLYGPKNLLNIAGIGQMSIFAEILPGADTCAVWMSDAEETVAWRALDSIADMITSLANHVWTDDCESIDDHRYWTDGLEDAGDNRVTQPATSVMLHDRSWPERPEAQASFVDAPAWASIPESWPDAWLER